MPASSPSNPGCRTLRDTNSIWKMALCFVQYNYYSVEGQTYVHRLHLRLSVIVLARCHSQCALLWPTRYPFLAHISFPTRTHISACYPPPLCDQSVGGFAHWCAHAVISNPRSGSQHCESALRMPTSNIGDEARIATRPTQVGIGTQPGKRHWT